MKLIIVEDERPIVEALMDDLEGILRAEEITICRSRDSAIEAIAKGAFDFALLDLKIPTSGD